MVTETHPEGSVLCFVDFGTKLGAACMQVGERLAEALDAPLVAHPAPRRGVIGWPPETSRAAAVILPAEQPALAGLWRRSRSPALAKRLGVPTVLVSVTASGPRPTDPAGELVCGVDRSRGARSAALAAAALAERLRLPLALVHAQAPEPAVAIAPVGAGATGLPRASLEEEEARDAGWDLLAAIDRITPQRARLRLRRGRPATCLDDYAARHDAPLIVVGAPVSGRVASFLLGSTAWDLSRQATVPVMYVPERFVSGW